MLPDNTLLRDTGLFAAPHGLVAWFQNCDKTNTATELKLRPEQGVLFAQTVGYAAKG